MQLVLFTQPTAMTVTRTGIPRGVELRAWPVYSFTLDTMLMARSPVLGRTQLRTGWAREPTPLMLRDHLLKPRLRPQRGDGLGS